MRSFQSPMPPATRGSGFPSCPTSWALGGGSEAGERAEGKASHVPVICLPLPRAAAAGHPDTAAVSPHAPPPTRLPISTFRRAGRGPPGVALTGPPILGPGPGRTQPAIPSWTGHSVEFPPAVSSCPRTRVPGFNTGCAVKLKCTQTVPSVCGPDIARDTLRLFISRCLKKPV